MNEHVLNNPDQQVYDQQIIESRNAQIGINPEGGYVTSWKVRNPQGELVDILYQGKTLKRTGIPILFPHFGKADGMRPHGFGRDSLWNVSADGNRTTMTLTSDDISEEAANEYPYSFDAAIIVEVEEDGSMLYHLQVRNMGTENLPLSPGLHPYWKINHNDKPKMKIEGLNGFDATQEEWDTNPPDTPYEYNGKITIDLPDRVITIEDVTDNQPVVEHVMVWSQTPEKDDFNLVCVEPVTRLHNAIHENPINVAPGDEFNMKIRFSTSFK
ncbi:MAG TPA: hypothetical protein VK338_01595 [Candidatus Nitrosocosmicus sp.]|nr:hypothetical protein [Candidatus Nitrosocosmicus sp.]